IKKVKTKLEEKHGKLQDVSVAAAGRALKTVKTKKNISILNQPMTYKESVHHIELNANKQTQIELVKANNQQITKNHNIVKLEEKHGKLQDVSVAAAGRALKTVKTKKNISILNQPMTSKESVHHLELNAIQQAQIELVKANNQQFTNYHCVGYSVLHYYIDD